MRQLIATRRRKLWLAFFVAAVFLYLVSQATPRRADRAAPWLPVLPPRETATQTVAVLGQAVEALSGRRVNVYCWSTSDWERQRASWNDELLGPLTPWRSYTSSSDGSIELGPNTCTQLERLRGRPDPIWKSDDQRAAAWSVQSVAHESMHVAGVRDEAKAECYGMQRIPLAAVQLGLTPAEGRYLGRLYWRDWYRRSPGQYNSPECRNGGGLDLHPRSDIWP